MQGLVKRAPEIKILTHPLLINTNLTRDESNRWYFKAVVEVEKLKKDFEIESPENFVYTECRKWYKSVENSISAKFNLRRIHLVYVIRKDDSHMTIIFDDIKYDVNPEDCRINAAPLTGAVFKRKNVEVQKLLKSLTQGTKA